MFAYKSEIDRWMQRRAQLGFAAEIDRQKTVTKDERDKTLAIRQKLELWQKPSRSSKNIRAVESRGAQLRLEAIETQLAAAFSVCAAAKNALVLRRLPDARKAIEKMTYAAQSIRAHVNERDHLPADSIAGVLERLAKLEKEISNLKERFSS